METQELKVELDGPWTDWVSGTRVTLYYDPEKHRVYSFPHVGSGWPAAAHGNLHRVVGSVSPDVVPEELEKAIREHAETFSAWRDAYVGSEWDGNKFIGIWADAGEEKSFDFSGVPAFWAVDDWMNPADPASILLDLIRAGSLRKAAEAEVKDAKDNGAWLDLEEVEHYIECCATDRIEHMLEDGPMGKTETAELEALQKILDAVRLEEEGKEKAV